MRDVDIKRWTQEGPRRSCKLKVRDVRDGHVPKERKYSQDDIEDQIDLQTKKEIEHVLPQALAEESQETANQILD